MPTPLKCMGARPEQQLVLRIFLLLILSSCAHAPQPVVTVPSTVEVQLSARGDSWSAAADESRTGTPGVRSARAASGGRSPHRPPPGPPSSISKGELKQLAQQLSTLPHGSDQYWSMLTKMVWVACRHGFGSEASALFNRALGAGVEGDMKMAHEYRMKIVTVFSACASATDASRAAGGDGGAAAGGAAGTSTQGSRPTQWTWLSPDAAANGRCPEPSEGPNPAFVLIGAEKSGTTSAFEYLGHHQSIALVTRKKEPYTLLHVLVDSFNRTLGGSDDIVPLDAADARAAYDLYVKRTFDKDLLQAGELTFEASPRYYVYSDLAPLFYQVLPCAKIVVTLREPLERAQSQYWHDTCTAGPHYRDRLVRTQEARTDGTGSLLTFEEVLQIEMAQYDRCATAHGPLPESMASLRTSTAALARWRSMWKCLSVPTLVGRGEALDLSRRMYFGYLIPSMYVFPLERWLDVYPRDQFHVLDFGRFTANATRNDHLSDFTGALGLADWSSANHEKVGRLGAFMSSPCFAAGETYPQLSSPGSIEEEDVSIVGAVRTRLQELNRLLVELVGVELEWVGASSTTTPNPG